ncbi:growth factor receptor-bound protein 14-like isoform X2 [Daktulosphaira vitifoliae]|uniref:growth factor receptor-bound protein 14-like isoform X2 n=1 Tax=Daktulosphaira vitifoliae TaxID=58002 RepID=UPI0021A9C82A|nr:growth factor receptor-bound protein 14-like isoform X2 [Daktulosphaira vitifoliae]
MTSLSPYKKLEEYKNQSFELSCISRNINIYNSDDSYQSIYVSSETTAKEVCFLLTNNLLEKCYEWSIQVIWKDKGIERTLESHELVLLCFYEMEPENNDRILKLQHNVKMFDMFKHPEEFCFHKMLDFDENPNEKARYKIIERVLNGEIKPLHYDKVWIFDCNNPKSKWETTILLLKDKKLYLSQNYQNVVSFIKNFKTVRNFLNGKITDLKDKCQLKVWAYLDDYTVYTTNGTTLADVPTPHCLCLVTTTTNAPQLYVACRSETLLSYWMCAMRLSKYGKQLRDNYRSFLKKQGDVVNDYEYSKKPLPNESVRSHVAMDFTGNVGRIVEDPKEALAIAQAETGSVRRSWRSSGRSTPGLQAAITRLENDVHLSQPWYHKNMSRDQAANILNRHGNKDGVFLIRESKSKCGSYVLTFKCGGKIIHTPIAAQMDPIYDVVCFTLDNGVTKFYDLLQLVEFYQLNAGSLPTRLMHYVVQVPVAK